MDLPRGDVAQLKVTEEAQNAAVAGVDSGPSHTAYPAHVRDAKDGILTTPAGSQAKPAHTGHAAPDLRELTKPTGTKQEKIVGHEHAAHLTPSGTLLYADRAIVPTEN